CILWILSPSNQPLPDAILGNGCFFISSSNDSSNTVTKSHIPDIVKRDSSPIIVTHETKLLYPSFIFCRDHAAKGPPDLHATAVGGPIPAPDYYHGFWRIAGG